MKSDVGSLTAEPQTFAFLLRPHLLASKNRARSGPDHEGEGPKAKARAASRILLTADCATNRRS